MLTKPPRIYIKKAAVCGRKGKMNFPENVCVPTVLLGYKSIPTRMSKEELIEEGFKFPNLMLYSGQSIRFMCFLTPSVKNNDTLVSCKQQTDRCDLPLSLPCI